MRNEDQEGDALWLTDRPADAGVRFHRAPRLEGEERKASFLKNHAPGDRGPEQGSYANYSAI